MDTFNFPVRKESLFQKFGAFGLLSLSNSLHWRFWLHIQNQEESRNENNSQIKFRGISYFNVPRLRRMQK